MINSNLEGVDFLIANTDAQALQISKCPNKIQLGLNTTRGLGAGMRPDIGKQAAEEAIQELNEKLDSCHMLFIAAGMGGGTGTGAAPVIAKLARERGILTVGVVTKPFHFEGSQRMKLAEKGIEEIQQHVDTLLIIPNQNLFRIANEKTTFADAFKMADDVLYAGVRGVTDLMVQPGLINLDFSDVKTVMSEMGKAMMGTAQSDAAEGRAIEAAEKSWNSWKSKTAKERSNILKNWFHLIEDNHEDLAKLMTIEQGKPLLESRGEITYGASFVEWFAEECRRVYGDTIPDILPDRRAIVIKQPVGVVGAITPWNFPSSMITRKCAPALAVGCPVVIKPASQTPYSAIALAVLAEQAGFPAGVFNIVTGSAKEIGEELTENPLVKKFSFTGSTEVGKQLLKQSASTVKKVSMELGGHAPFIVFEDANVDEAVIGVMQSKFRNSGQTCICANRIFVHEKIYDEFLNKFVKEVEKIKVGNGLDSNTNSGPLIDQYSLKKVKEHVNDAVNTGAKVAIGGDIHELGGYYFQPTVLSNVTTKAKITYEETFGPVAPLYKFSSCLLYTSPSPRDRG